MVSFQFRNGPKYSFNDMKSVSMPTKITTVLTRMTLYFLCQMCIERRAHLAVPLLLLLFINFKTQSGYRRVNYTCTLYFIRHYFILIFFYAKYIFLLTSILFYKKK